MCEKTQLLCKEDKVFNFPCFKSTPFLKCVLYKLCILFLLRFFLLSYLSRCRTFFCVSCHLYCDTSSKRARYITVQITLKMWITLFVCLCIFIVLITDYTVCCIRCHERLMYIKYNVHTYFLHTSKVNYYSIACLKEEWLREGGNIISDGTQQRKRNTHQWRKLWHHITNRDSRV